ncbi:MAG: hypothetical protein LQ342_002707 [Letrouitia transgressa]|nr:MAG: hypothetical protein LQ342_002707 [Letrouitia transgressa]
MKFLQHIRSRSKLRNGDESQLHDPNAYSARSRTGRDTTSVLPLKLLTEVLSCVCPHTKDDNYLSLEESMREVGCMLCDLRDLAQCALVSRRFLVATQTVLYHNVRIDPVHYCEREIDLAAKRKRKSFFERNAEPVDAPKQRIEQLSRTVRDNQSLAIQVEFLKMPYMTRETCIADLARTVSVLPNLRYVDLPDGIYSDDRSCSILKQELEARCSDLRKMKYLHGAEKSFTMLSHSRPWQNLEILELARLEVEPSTLVSVLASFPVLLELKLEDLPLIDDNIFKFNPNVPSFPSITKLCLQNTPRLTAAGLEAYLLRPEAREVLSSLKLFNTGVLPSQLHRILAIAPYLTTLHMNQSVSRALPSSPPISPLASQSLRTFYYEIESPSSTSTYDIQPPSESYYHYLSTSLSSGNNFPSLSTLYALSTSLPTLLLPPPLAPFAAANPPRSGGGGSCGLRQPLTLYTKSIPEHDWNITIISPPSAGNRRGSATATRPVSFYNGSTQLGPQWGDKARDSVIVGNGFGGFLAVPADDGRPGSSSSSSWGGHRHKHSRSKGSKGWMG